MKGLYILLIVIFITTIDLSAQTLSRYTTGELVNKLKTNSTAFNSGYAEDQFNYALPLIDSVVAVELAKLSGLSIENNYVYAISLQCRDDSLKNMVLNNLLAHDKLCNSDLISKNKYDQSGAAGIYEYGRLSNAMLAQTNTNDTNLLKIAIKEFEYWAPMAQDYIDIIMKPGMHQLAIKSGKRKFTPCTLASAGNCNLWIACIYLITGKEEYGSSNEQLNDTYRKLMKKLRIDKRMNNRKEFIRFGKESSFASTAVINTLDSLDFETIPELKEKFNNVTKKDNARIILYTHSKKALLYLDYTEMVRMGLSKQLMSSSTLYLVELNSPTTIRLTKINYRDRYN